MNKIYKHFKGKLIRVVCIGLNHEKYPNINQKYRFELYDDTNWLLDCSFSGIIDKSV